MKTKLYASLVVSALALGLAFSGSVSASPTYCSTSDPDPHPMGLGVGDMTWQGSNADDCYGVVIGNPDTKEGDTLKRDEWGEEFVFLVKADDDENPTGTFAGVEFTLTADIDAKEGSWTLSWQNVDSSDPGLPITLDFVGNLKAGAGYASYLFESITFGDEPSTGSGEFKIAFTQPGGGVTLTHQIRRRSFPTSVCLRVLRIPRMTRITETAIYRSPNPPLWVC